ncbi:MAG: hypothetical protein IPG54_01205 [Sphingomonadales bacterium]|jgi:phytoene synthase|nr:hypothetical protein [Sphingomonadales bacterium]
MDADQPLTPPQLMAAAYAKPELQEALSLLLEFDNRLMAIAAKGQEPLIKQLRLAWWREQLEKERDAYPRGEPLLARVGGSGDGLKLVPALRLLVDAWDQIISSEGDMRSAAIGTANQLRVDAVFGSYANWVGSCIPTDAIRAAGDIWARGSIGLSASAERVKLLPGLKPLNLLCLAYAVDRDASGFARFRRFMRMGWHGLTGW